MAKPFKGAVKIDRHSSLRKLMRAARRGKLPPEVEGTIRRAEHVARLRRDRYRNAHAARA